jgi:anti-sigma-K factor RskA
MNAHDEMLDNVAVYALGVLPPEEANSVRRHLMTCPECREEYRALAPAVDSLAYSAEACEDAATAAASVAPPGPLLKKRIMRKVRPNVGEMAAVRPIVWPAYAVAAACLAIALVTGIVDISLSSQVQSSNAKVTALAKANNSMHREIAMQYQQLADLVATNSAHYPVAYGQVVKHGSRLYIAMDTLPPPPKGKVYQAWTLHQGSSTMTPSITFVPSTNGVEVQPLPVNAKQIVAVALSVEPIGGSKQPTSKPVFVVKLS